MLLSCVQLFSTLWTVAHQAPLSMGFSRQEYWSGLPFPSPGDLPNPGIEPWSPVWQTDALLSSHQGNLRIRSDQISCSVVSDSLWPHGLQHARLPCPSPSPWVSLLVYIHTHTNQYFQHIIQYISLGKEFFKVSGHWGTVWNSSLWCRYQKIIFVLVLS